MSLELMAQIIVFVFSCGVVYGQIKSFGAELKTFRKEYKEDMKTLTEKVEKHNTFDRRLVKLETIAEIKGGLNEQNPNKNE